MLDTDIFRSMSYGVYVVSTMDEGRPTGCVANSIMQITASPPTVALSMNHDNYTNACIDKSGVFAFSVLGEKTDVSVIGTFGFQSGRDVNKFEQIDYDMVAGLPVLKNSCGYVVCKVMDKMETSTHTVFLGEVVEAGRFAQHDNAMTYRYYHEVIKLKSPKNAPTYLPEKEAE